LFKNFVETSVLNCHIDDLAGFFEQGLVENFFPNNGLENNFIAGLVPTNAIINCPVICNPTIH